jgi:hypothetical protein
MKRIVLSIFLLGAISFSCDDRLEDLNTPRTAPTVVPGETLFTNGLREMFDQMQTINVNVGVWKLYSQYWAQTTYPDESQYNMVTRSIPASIYANMYRDALQDLTQGRALIEGLDEAEISLETKANQLATIDIVCVYIWSVLVDTFGHVPYSEALDSENLNPKYDDMTAIYDDILVKLDAAIAALDDSQAGISATQDLVYSGDVSKWKMAANSLKLRLGMRLADVNASKSQSMVTEALASGIITENADNFSMKYLSGSPNTNPQYDDLVLSGRSDFVLANTIADKLNDLSDPRIFTYARNPIPFPYQTNAQGTKIDSVIVDGEGLFVIYEDANQEDSVTWNPVPFTMFAADSAHNPVIYKGGEYGTANSYKTFAQVGDLFHTPDLPGAIITAAEMHFLLAEAAERGFPGISGAEDFYNLGIERSMEEWGVSEEAASAYLEQPAVAYATAAGDWKQKIGSQLWLSLFNNGFEGWTTWRRLDFDGFNVPDGLEFSDIPVRMIYPINEGQRNKTSKDDAASRLSAGDTPQSKIFWDIN